MKTLGHVLGHLWMLPLTLIGLIIVALHCTLFSRPVRVLVDGKGVAFTFPGKLWGMENLRGQCIGGVVLLAHAAGAQTLIHESRHVLQQMVLGPFVLIAYPVSSIVAKLRGKHWYWDNALEIDARKAAKQFVPLLLALSLVGCGGDFAHELAGAWTYTGGEGTYSCNTGASGGLSTRPGATVRIEDTGEGLRMTYPGNCPGGFMYDYEGRSVGGECRYATDVYSAILTNMLGSSLELKDGVLTDRMSQRYTFSYPDDTEMTCQVFVVSTASPGEEG